MDKVVRKRERIEIIYDILKIVRDNNNSIRPTRLLRYSNLSSKNFYDYMNELTEKELLKELTDSKGKKYFTLTNNGFNYVEKYTYIKGFIKEFNL